MTRNQLFASAGAHKEKGRTAAALQPQIQDFAMLNVAQKSADNKVAALFSEANALEARRARAWLADRISSSGKLPPDEFMSEVVAVTPALAEIILAEHNEGNRPLKKDRFSYAQAMREGRWRLHSQGISFSREGKLNNGQNRLTAVVLSGCTVKMMVTFGEDRGVFGVLDTGTVRGGADTLHVRGHKNTACLAAAARLFLIVTGPSPRGNASFSNDIIAEVAAAHPGLEVSTTLGQGVAKKLRCSTAATVTAFYLIASHSAFSRRLEPFAQSLGSGADLPVRNPILVLREGLKDKTIGVRRAVASEECAAIIYAWNLWVRGRKASAASLRWADGAPFPRPE